MTTEYKNAEGLIGMVLASAVDKKLIGCYEDLSGFNRKKHIESCTKSRKKRKSKHK